MNRTESFAGTMNYNEWRIFRRKEIRRKILGYSAILTTKSLRNLRQKIEANIVPEFGSKKVLPTTDRECQRSRGFAPPLWRPNCDSVVLPESRLPVIRKNRMCPRPHRGQGWRKGAVIQEKDPVNAKLATECDGQTEHLSRDI